MPGRTPRLTPLEARKRLLIAESDLNRAQLAGDLRALAGGARELGDRARTWGGIAASALALVAGLLTVLHRRSAGGDVQGSWPSRLIRGCALLAALWQGCQQRAAVTPPGRRATSGTV